MKYEYNITKKVGLIKGYNVVDDNIFIEFLDESKFSIPNSLENEKIVLDKMIEQAKERNKEVNIEALNEDKDEHFLNFMNNLLFWYITHLSIECINNASIQFFCLLVIGINSYFASKNFINFYKCNKEIEELEKYDIYLDIMDDLEVCNNQELFYKVDNDTKSLNINTLDNYSLKEIKQIKSNLINSKEYIEYLNKKDNSKIQKRNLSI